MALLDVNVLIALLDPDHTAHDDAHAWFEGQEPEGWASCALTENCCIRILSHASYRPAPVSAVRVADSLRELMQDTRHEFWAENVSLLDPTLFAADQIGPSHRVTDAYLLGLARHRGGRLATFDRRISTRGVIDAEKSLLIIPSSKTVQ
jgi:toxin-antitoxin system PIN domain toxin